MASIVKADFGVGGANLSPGDGAGQPDLATVIRELVDENTDLRTKYAALLAKLDADGGVTDTDYAATLALEAQLVTKG